MIYKLLLVAATVIWGSSFVLAKDLLDVITPQWLLAIRFGSAAIVLALFCIKKYKVFAMNKHALYGAIMGLFMYGAYATQTIGLMGTTPGKNAFLTAVYSVLVPFVAWWIAKRKPNKFNISAALLSIIGVGFISLSSIDSGISAGDALSLCCAGFYAFHIVCTAKFSQKRDIYVLTTVQFAVVGALACIMALIFEPLPNFAQFGNDDWFSLWYLALACTLVALSFQNIGQQHTAPASAALLLSLESPMGVVFSVAMGAETLTVQVCIGFVLVFAAVLVSELMPQLSSKRRENILDEHH